MNIYINAIANISPQHTFDDEVFLEPLEHHANNYFKSIEPDYKAYIDPKNSRRMGRILKMGVMAANRCLENSHIKVPDAIITGTGFGCLEDTENFLTRIIENNEQFLTPTSFIQSTHNTISAQIALLLNCHNYNFTYVHRGFSFESSLLDAMMLIREKSAATVLIGGLDEITPNFYTLTNRTGKWKQGNGNSFNLLEQKTTGSIPGEGAAFFLLSSEKTEATRSQVLAMTTIYKPSDHDELETKIDTFLKDAGMRTEDVDLLLLGLNGDLETDHFYYALKESHFKNTNAGYFKHLCGEYLTASAFGMWLACKTIRHQHVPEIIKLGRHTERPIRNVFLYNHLGGANHSLILISAC